VAASSGDTVCVANGIEVDGTENDPVTNTRIANNLIDSPAVDGILATDFDGLEID
jgi:hypothetical protein